jgi:membrane associated rhomboid family serine protease
MFIPLGDDNSQRRTFPFVVMGLIALNALVWYFQLRLGEHFTAGFSSIPFELTHGVDLVKNSYLKFEGTRIPIPQAPGPHPIYLTVLTSMFMHAGWMHIIGNMLYLYIFGDQIEDEMGHLKFLVFYIGAGIAAALAQIFMNPDSIIPCVGASGAIAGVLGAYLVLHPRNLVRVLVIRTIVHMRASVVLGLWIVMQVISQVGSPAAQAAGVAYMAHIGGFAAGFAVALGMRAGNRKKRAGYSRFDR